MQSKERYLWPWWATSVILAMATATFLAILLPTSIANWRAIVAIAALAFFFFWFQNPAYRYFRLACQILTFWVIASAGSQVFLFLNVGQDSLAFQFANDTSWMFHGGMCVALIAALVIDYRSRFGSPLWVNLRDLININSNQQFMGENRGTQNNVQNVVGDLHIHNYRQATESELDEALGASGKVESASIREGSIHDQIDAAAAYINEGKPDVALEFLLKLRQRQWHVMDSRAKFRTLANLGHCYNRQEKFDEALPYFEEALTHQPTDPEARALVASAYFSAGDDTEARLQAEAILEEHPNVATAHVVVLRTDLSDTASEDQWNELPVIVQRDVSVRLTLGFRAIRRQELSFAKKIAREGLNDAKHRTDFEILDAATTINEVSARIFASPPATEEEKISLAEAVKKLEEAEIEVLRTPGQQQLGQLYFYLASANRLLGRKAEAEYAFRQAIKACPSATDIGRQFATMLYEDKRPDDAIVVLEAEPHEKDPESCVTLAYHLAERDGMKDRERAITLLQNALKDEDLRLVTICNAFNLLGQLKALNGDNEEVRQSIRTIQRSDLSEAHRLALQATTYKVSGSLEQATEFAKKAATALGDSEDEIAYWDVASVCKSCGMFNEALWAFQHFVTPTSRHSLLMEVLECADRGDNKVVLLSFCKQMREEGVYLDEAIELEAFTREKFDDIEGTLEVLDEFLALGRSDYFTKLVKLRKAVLGIKYSRPELLYVDFQELPLAGEAEPDIGRLVIAVLRAQNNVEEAIRYAYAQLRNHFESAMAHKAFAIAIGEPGNPAPLPNFSEVKPGAAVYYEAIVGEEKGWWILEDAPDAKQELREISLEHPIAKELLGKSVGDEFVLRRSEVHEQKGTILSLMSKYQYRYKDVIDNWQDRFPNKFFVTKIEMGEDECGKPDITPILKSVDQRAAETEELHELYRSGPLSVASFAVMSGVDVIDAAMHLASEATLGIPCSFGNDEEHSAALACTATATRIVLCPSAVATLWLTRAFEFVTNLPFRLLVPKSVIEQVRRKSEDQAFKGSGFLAKIGEQYVFTKHNEDQAREYEEAFRRFYQWLKANSDVESGLALAEIPSTLRNNLTEIFGDEVAQAMSLAKKQGLPLWTDDLGVAELSRVELKVERTWTEVVLTSVVANDGISAEEYAHMIAKLNGYGYRHTRLIPHAVLAAAKLAAWHPKSWPLPGIIEWCSSPFINPAGIARVAGFAMPLLWREATLPEQAEAVAKSVFDGVKSLPDGDQLLRAIIRNMDRFFGVDALNAENCRRVAEAVLRSNPPGRWIMPGDGGTPI